MIFAGCQNASDAPTAGTNDSAASETHNTMKPVVPDDGEGTTEKPAEETKPAAETRPDNDIKPAEESKPDTAKESESPATKPQHAHLSALA